MRFYVKKTEFASLIEHKKLRLFIKLIKTHFEFNKKFTFINLVA